MTGKKSSPRDYVALANQYIADVLSGAVPACKYVRQACERQRKDLARQRGFAYVFDAARAAHICRFVELLPHTKGEWAGTLITLEPWQVFLLTTIFGWVDKRGRRRFKQTYLEIPRKNAKSTLSSGVGLYMLAADGEGGAEVYSAATTRDQAKIVWQDAHRMAQNCKGLQARFGVKVSAHAIYTEDGSKFGALARDQGGNLDGLNTHCAIIDELHAHKTREVVDVMDTSTGARTQPLLWQITTAGFNRAGICYDTRSYALKVLGGAAKDEQFFGIVYTIDKDDEWSDPKVWAKANPNWGISVNPEDIQRKATKALTQTADQNNFLTKHLNVWVNAATAWMDMKKWEAGADETLSLADFAGEPCWIGVDLATKSDLTAWAALFKRGQTFYLFTHFYLPEAKTEGPDNAMYAAWVKEGRITTTPGNVTDQNVVQEDVRKLANAHDVKSVGFDSWQGMKFAGELADEGLPMSEFKMQVRNVSAPMKEYGYAIIEGQLQHTGCPVMGWMMSNVTAHQDANDNIFPRKDSYANKIDGPVAAIIAFAQYEQNHDESSVYETRGLLLW